MKNSLISGAVALALFSSVAVAGDAGEQATKAPQASLLGIEGTVLVNTGERFVNTRDDTQLAAGDRVLLMNEASAQLLFADGCDVSLQAESMITIGEASPCAGQELEVNRVGPMTAQAMGASGATTTRAPDTTAWVVFGSGAAAIAYLIIDGDLTITESTVPPPPVSP
ncbi:hypothetical protein [Alkalisalibacterium limincola]|uniref:Organic solvent tolerance-like N-terminal domain-containing protein n=1 Tax=Alkalisalibacterium limincola TaxID=2699169 RepID=A0A5C8L040_9GAMM|nr:hypothetical protein [Alkalisalibacterium limincola]TXK65605.1 hypothetical protein FU658_00245 [Alkalisalibacterium limincola]